MKKVYIVLGIVALVAVVNYYLANKCKEPSDLEIAVRNLECTVQLFNRPVEQLREEFCQYLQRGESCDIFDEDRPKLIEMMNLITAECTKASLAKENFCVDKVNAVVRGIK